MGRAGPEEAWDCERRVLTFTGTAIQPYFSIAGFGLLILRLFFQLTKSLGRYLGCGVSGLELLIFFAGIF